MEYLNYLNFLIIISIIIYLCIFRRENYEHNWNTENGNTITVDDNGDLNSVSNNDLINDTVQKYIIDSKLFIPKDFFGYSANPNGYPYIFINIPSTDMFYKGGSNYRVTSNNQGKFDGAANNNFKLFSKMNGSIVNIPRISDSSNTFSSREYNNGNLWFDMVNSWVI